MWLYFENLSGNGFTWSDGSAVDYTFWAPEYPNHDDVENQCAILSSSMWKGAWMDTDCDVQKSNYVCKTTKGTKSCDTEID